MKGSHGKRIFVTYISNTGLPDINKTLSIDEKQKQHKYKNLKIISRM